MRREWNISLRIYEEGRGMNNIIGYLEILRRDVDEFVSDCAYKRRRYMLSLELYRRL